MRSSKEKVVIGKLFLRYCLDSEANKALCEDNIIQWRLSLSCGILCNSNSQHDNLQNLIILLENIYTNKLCFTFQNVLNTWLKMILIANELHLLNSKTTATCVYKLAMFPKCDGSNHHYQWEEGEEHSSRFYQILLLKGESCY